MTTFDMPVGSDPATPKALDDVEAALKLAALAPPVSWPAFLSGLLRQLRGVPVDASPIRLADLLVEIGIQYHLDGSAMGDAVAPLSLAVYLFDTHGAERKLRRALSIQGLVLGSGNLIQPALTALTRALDIAETSGDSVGIVAAWINLGTVFEEAAMWHDLLNCMGTASRLANELRVSDNTGLKARAMHGQCVAHWLLGSYQASIDAAREALHLLRESTDPESETVKAVTEVVMSKAFVALYRLDEAEHHANRASVAALRSGSARAQADCRLALLIVNALRNPSVHALVALDAQIEAVDDFSRHGGLLKALIDVYEALGRTDKAVGASRRLLLWARKKQSAALSQAIDRSKALRLRPRSDDERRDAQTHCDLRSLAARCGTLFVSPLPHE